MLSRRFLVQYLQLVGALGESCTTIGLQSKSDMLGFKPCKNFLMWAM